MAATQPAGALRVQLLGSVVDGAETDVTTGTSQAVDVSAYQNLVVYLVASAALSAGTLIIEEADFDPSVAAPYTGTWSQITSVTLATPFASAGGQYAYHCGGPGGSYNYGFVRARIGTAVVGGTLGVVLRAN